MPLAESLAAFEVSIATTTFLVTTGPEALERLSDSVFKAGSAFKKSHDRANFVLNVLDQYCHVLSDAETRNLVQGFWEIIGTMNQLRDLTLQNENAPADEAGELQKRKWKNIKVVKKLTAYSKIRAAANESLKVSKEIYVLADRTAMGARMKNHARRVGLMSPLAQGQGTPAHHVSASQASVNHASANQGRGSANQRYPPSTPATPPPNIPASDSQVSLRLRGSYPASVFQRATHVASRAKPVGMPADEVLAGPVAGLSLQNVEEAESDGEEDIADNASYTTRDSLSLAQEPLVHD